MTKTLPVKENTRNLKKKKSKTQGILFAQVVNSLILKLQDITIFAIHFLSQSQIAKNVTGPIYSWTGKTQGICK